MQAFLGVPEPIAGFMRAEDIFPSGCSLAYARFATPQVECELAVRLAHDLPAGPIEPAAAAAAVADLTAAIEIVENRYGPPPIGDLAAVGIPTLIADQMYHAACVVGPAAPNWRRLDPGTLMGRISIDGDERDHGLGAELLGHPWRALAWLAGSEVARQFGGLRAGQVVMLGSVTPSIALNGPCVVRVVFDGLPAAEIRFA
jgi:2-keto-4-pentenoate hydratase